MRAYRLSEGWPLEPATNVTESDLLAEGIIVTYIPVDDPFPVLEYTVMWPVHDTIELTQSQMTPEQVKAYGTEHRHESPEVRYILDGNGIFDIRDRKDRMLRVHVEAGDLLILPGERWHRFVVDGYIKAQRRFVLGESWKSEYRNATVA